MRYLFVTVDSAGALHPQIALAQRLAGRGHDVRFLACRSQRAAIERAGFTVRCYLGAPDFDFADPANAIRDWTGEMEERFARYGEVIWFGPAADVARAVLDEVAHAPVDALVLDYFAFGATIAAELLDLPTAVLWHTVYHEWDVFDALGIERLNAARVELGLAPDGSIYDAYHRADLVLSLTSEAFAGERAVPPNLRHAGPQLPPGCEPDLEHLSSATSSVPRVLVCLGTSYQHQEDLLARVIGALGDMEVRAVVGTGTAVTVAGTPPPNVEVAPWVDHASVLPGTHLVVTHAGLGTIMAATSFGVPLVCLPLGRDQHSNAERVAELGIGTIADPSAGQDALRDAFEAALRDDPMRERARELAAAHLGRYDDGALALEQFAAPARVSASRAPERRP